MTIHLKNYLSLCDGVDAVPAIRAALEETGTGDTLCLGGGTLHLYPTHSTPPIL